MKVMQLLPALNQGGVERGTLDVSRALVEAGHTSVVVSAGGRLVCQLDAHGAQHVTLDIGRKSLSTLFKAFALKRLIQTHRPDIVHLRSRLPAWVYWMAHAMLPLDQRPRVVSTLHGMNSVGWYSKVMTRADQVIAVSQTCLDYWKAHYPGAGLSAARVIYRGIDSVEFCPGDSPVRQQLGVAPDELVVAMPGRITSWKGHEALVQVAQLAGDRVRFWVIGEGKPGGDFEKKIRQQCANLPVDFLGHRDDMADCLRAADVSLSLTGTTMESFGRGPVESLACGTPVIAYDHGAVGETLGVLQPDGLVPVGDLNAVVAKLSALPKVPKSVEPFTLTMMLGQTLEVYQAMLADNS